MRVLESHGLRLFFYRIDLRVCENQSRMTNGRPKILSIDDHEMLNVMRQKVLAVAGYDCDLAYSAEQGLTMASTNRYDVVLLDYNLPGCCGLEVANGLKGICPSLPIVMVTGEELYESCDAVHSYLVKGEGPEALIAQLGKIVPATRKKAHSAAS
jgi:two-component system chemotaxis sensor kinase CheA